MTPNDALKNASPSAVMLVAADHMSPDELRAMAGKLLHKANAIEYQALVEPSLRHAQTSIDAARLVLGRP